MNCDKVRQLLDAFAAGEMEAAERQIVEDHLGECPACQKELAAMRRTIRLLTEFREMDPPADFVQALRQRIETPGRRPVLERWLRRPVFARVLAGATCLILAGFGIWLAVRQLFPREGIEKYQAGDKIAGERIAFVRGEEGAHLIETGKKLGSEERKAEERLEVVEEDFTEEVPHFDTSARRRGKAAAKPSERPAAEPAEPVGAKGAPVGGDWGRVATLSAEEKPAVEGEIRWADTQASRRYAVQLEDVDADRVAGERRVDAPVKALARTLPAEPALPEAEGPGDEKAKAEGRDVLREDFDEGIAARTRYGAEGKDGPYKKKEAEKRLREMIEKEGVREETAGIKLKGDVSQEPTAWSMDDESRVAKYRVRSGQGMEKTAKEVGRDAIELRHGEEELAGETTSLGMIYNLQQLQQDESEPTELPEDYAYIPLFFNGADLWTEGGTRLPEIQAPDSGLRRQLHFSLGDFAAYDAFTTGTPALVRYVKDRNRARAEIEKIVADLGGSITTTGKATEKLGRSFGEQTVDSLIVKLNPNSYDKFVGRLGGERLQKLIPHRGSAVAASVPAEPGDERAAKPHEHKKEEEVTLVIFLVEISQQKPPEQPSQSQPPSDS